MQVKEVYNDAASLTGENTFESAKWFYLNLNRALDQINRLRPQEKSVMIYHKAPACALEQLNPRYIKAGDSWEADSVTGLSFRASGIGSMKITDTSNPDSPKYIAWQKPADEPTALRKALLIDLFSGPVAPADLDPDYLVFDHIKIEVEWCSAGAMISNLALYSDPTAPLQEYSRFIEYKMADLVDDFEEFAKMPLIIAGRYADEIGYRLGNKSILIPRKARADEYEIVYRRRLNRSIYTSSPETDTTEVDVRPDLEDLLPLLTAYYCNLYSDPEAAAELKRNYDEQVAMYLRLVQVPRSEALADRNGWLNG